MIDAAAIDREVQRQRSLYQRTRGVMAAAEAKAAAGRRQTEAAVAALRQTLWDLHRDVRVRRRAAPLLPSVAYWKTRAILEDVARTQAPPAIVVRERAHLLAIARREGIVVRIAGDCDAQQGYAFRARHRVEVSPLVSMFACATLAHEIGHALDPSHASRERRELNAWRWRSATCSRGMPTAGKTAIGR